MKPLFTVVTIALSAFAAYAGESAAGRPFVVPDNCVWIEFTATNHSLDADGPGGIFAKHRGLTRAEDLRIAEITFFDESGTEGPSLPFDGMLRLFASGVERHQVEARSYPAELFVKRESPKLQYGLWVDRKTRFPIRYVVLRPFSFVWREFFLLDVANPPLELWASKSATSTDSLRSRYAEQIKTAKRSFEVLLLEQAWRIEKLK